MVSAPFLQCTNAQLHCLSGGRRGRSLMWGTSKSKLGSHAKYGHLSNFVHKQELKRGGPLGEFPMRRQNPLLSFSSCSARSLLPTSLPPSPVSNGIPTAPLFLLRAAVTKKSVQTVPFPVAAAAAAVCAAQIAGSLALGRWATRHRRRPSVRPRPPRQVS